ncbi:hypothetical protein C0J52_19510, partial [Blattella germanica]
GYGGQHTCVTYDAINQAYIQARKRIHVAQPKNPMWKTEEIATVGELLLDISINLAKTYGLSYEDIEKGLPLIDTSKTLIREVCPPFLANVECRPGKYRRYDGLCSNLQHPTWGATMTPFTRLVGPLYADGMTAPRISVTGNQLPLPRIVSRTVHPDEGFHDHAGTVMVVAWGQFMDHDYTLTATPVDPLNRNEPEECCHRPDHLKNPYCLEIQIPADDYFYSLFGLQCQDFVRGFPAVRPGCRLGSRSQFNTLTGVLDGNTVYGVSEKFASLLFLFPEIDFTGSCFIETNKEVFSVFFVRFSTSLVFTNDETFLNRIFACIRHCLKDKNITAFHIDNNQLINMRAPKVYEWGKYPSQHKNSEIRVNEQLVLTCMHTLMAREHNRVARGLAQVNPHWDDETLYQEARRIVIAEIQHITYNEFLPIILGKEVMEKFGLLTQKEVNYLLYYANYWFQKWFCNKRNAGVIWAISRKNEKPMSFKQTKLIYHFIITYSYFRQFSPMMKRVWISCLKENGYWDGYDPNVNPNVIDAFAAAAFRLSDLIRQPYDLYRAGVLDEYFMGLMNQVAQAMDDSVTQEVTNHLFKKPGARYGMDLASFNMQRGREFGLPGYMEFRHPSDVDLWSGGVSERPLPGSMVGPTFACIIATQFSYSRRGDRFWYELGNQPSSFTPEQLQEVRKAKLSRVICDNTDLIDSIQVYPMVLPDHEINPRVPCRSGVIPGIDFTKWADFGAQAAAPATPFVSNIFDQLGKK